ncbi:MAG: vWA domain-containing protein [Butyricicoccus pullicaecorum]
MGVTFANKTINTDQIDCTGTLLVTLALTAEPNILTSPTDIALVLDRSGSMTGQPLQSMKSGAKKFIEVISQSTSGANDGTIGSGSRIGIVSFAASATANTQLITSVAALDAAVNSLSAGGSTNHADAFTEAVQLFDASSPNRKVVSIHRRQHHSWPQRDAHLMAAKDDGITIYCIGLDAPGGLDVTALETWASAATSYVLITPDDSELEQFLPISPLISANRVRLISSLTRSFTPISPSPALPPDQAVRT